MLPLDATEDFVLFEPWRERLSDFRGGDDARLNVGARVLFQTLSALQHLHQRGLYHNAITARALVTTDGLRFQLTGFDRLSLDQQQLGCNDVQDLLRTVIEFLLGTAVRKYDASELFAAMAVKKQALFLVLRQLLFGQLYSVTEMIAYVRRHFDSDELLVCVQMEYERDILISDTYELERLQEADTLSITMMHIEQKDVSPAIQSWVSQQ